MPERHNPKEVSLVLGESYCTELELVMTTKTKTEIPEGCADFDLFNKMVSLFTSGVNYFCRSISKRHKAKKGKVVPVLF
jgi:hypothetical protein